MSNDAREGWLTREQVLGLKMGAQAMIESGEGLQHHENTMTLCRMALAALDAPVADEDERVAEFRELDMAWREWEALIHRDMTKPETRLHNAIAIVLAVPALHATPATTQGREAELREALAKDLDYVLGTFADAIPKELYHKLDAILTALLATPKPVEAPAQVCRECHGAKRGTIGQRDRNDEGKMRFDFWEGACPRCKGTGLEPEAPAQTGSECARCGGTGYCKVYDEKTDSRVIGDCPDCKKLEADVDEPACVCGNRLPCDYEAGHAPKPEATTELCAYCGWPKNDPIHNKHLRENSHPFTPAPKEQRP